MSFFFFNDTATTEIYTLSLHDALPIYRSKAIARVPGVGRGARHRTGLGGEIAVRIIGEGEDLTSRSEEHTSELQSLTNLVCRLLLEKKNNIDETSYRSREQ